MYWSRSGSLVDLLPWLALSTLWWAGGWLLAVHLFRLRPRERLLAGLVIGLLLFIVLANLLAHSLSLPAAWWGAALLVLAMGAASAWRLPIRSWFPAGDLSSWPQLLAAGALFVFFALINRGLAIYDDYFNLPLASMIAAGDIPPHFQLNVADRLAYHYGLHVFAGSLIRIAGFFPWSAFDIARALGQALTPVLAWLWIRRVTRSNLAGVIGALLVLLGSGSRWLLLLLPQGWLVRLGSDLRLLGSASFSGPDLFTLLGSPLKMEGVGPIQFPFAFMNGIFPPLVLALSGPGAFPQMTVILILLLARRRFRPTEGLVFGLLLASLALTAEQFFVLVLAGIGLAALIHAGLKRSLSGLRSWIWALFPALALAVFGGGVITEIGRGFLNRLVAASTIQSTGFTGFSLQWPPALVSAHLGPLSLRVPSQLLLALVEIGPAALIGLWVTAYAWKSARRGRLLFAGLALGAGLVFFIALFARYGVERDISRLPGSSLFVWMLLGFPLAWFAWHKTSGWGKSLLGTAYAVTILAGITILSLELTAVPHPQFTYYVTEPDALISRAYWNRLETGSQVFDPFAHRSVTLFGRGAGAAYQDNYNPLPGWLALLDAADPRQIAHAGYSYVYMDKAWWQQITPEQKQAFQQACVQPVVEQNPDNKDFRWLLDVSACR